MLTACCFGTKPSLILPDKPVALLQPCAELEPLTDPYSSISNAITNFGIHGECAGDKTGLNLWVEELYLEK